MAEINATRERRQKLVEDGKSLASDAVSLAGGAAKDIYANREEIIGDAKTAAKNAYQNREQIFGQAKESLRTVNPGKSDTWSRAVKTFAGWFRGLKGWQKAASVGGAAFVIILIVG